MEKHKCRGMRDLLPGDMFRFRHIEDVFRACCLKWGYQEVRTPTLEYLHLFTATGTLSPAMLGKVYSFLDWDGWSGERVVLRPDGTIPVARLYVNDLSEGEIARLFYVTNIFAFEETGKENRERWQCGAEFLGGAEAAGDAEIIMLAEEVVHRLGLDKVELQISHAGLVKALIKELMPSAGDEARLMSRVLSGDWQALTERKSGSFELDRLLSLLLNVKGKSSGFLRNMQALSLEASWDLRSALEDFTSTAVLLDSLGCDYEIDIAAIRDFEYYTGVCFQLLGGGERIGGGGRYDDLIPLMSGKNLPACGFALYVDSIMKLLPLESKQSGGSGVLVRSEELSPEVAKMCFDLAQSLRNAGYVAELDFAEREMSRYRWIVSVSGKRPSAFAIVDQKQKEHRDVACVEEVLVMLRG
jgi:histidyl-tRNA synthetase